MLVVDDDADATAVLTAVLEQCHARVVSCHPAGAALDRLETGDFDILISDIGMPEIDGVQFIKRVRERGWTMPAIAVSAYTREKDRDIAIAAGFTSDLTKPLDECAFLSAVAGLSGTAQASASAARSCGQRWRTSGRAPFLATARIVLWMKRNALPCIWCPGNSRSALLTGAFL